MNVVILDNKREKDAGKSKDWEDAETQLKDYMIGARRSRLSTVRPSKHKEPERDLFGIISFGRYSRFYVLREEGSVLRVCPYGYDGRILELRDDEIQIDKILRDIRDIGRSYRH